MNKKELINEVVENEIIKNEVIKNETIENEVVENETEPSELDKLKQELTRLRALEAEARAKVKEVEMARKKANAKPTRKFCFRATYINENNIEVLLNDRVTETFYYVEKDIIDAIKSGSINNAKLYKHYYNQDETYLDDLLVEEYVVEQDGSVTIK